MSQCKSCHGGFSYSTPYYGPSPFSGGVYFRPAVGFGVGAGSSFFLILVGFAAFILVSGFLSDRSDGSVLTAAGKTTVLKLQTETTLAICFSILTIVSRGIHL
ncbi:unnamed protein product [Trifolium pratense]|uniref:Uncharacterized protein n=1 Tax=Trifolium pratense TaxID=57577 RepID=A0ACB0IHP0_TRIPR|nr:unnamed protein product [Trifolium pratense]